MESKKAFDLEQMYRKIMPTGGGEPPLEAAEEPAGTGKPLSPPKPHSGTNAALLKEKDIPWQDEEAAGVVLCNVTEGLVLEKLDLAMGRMSCCKCDRCKRDILALAMNELAPHYVVNVRSAIREKVQKSELGQAATAAVLKAVLAVRQNPRH